MTGTSEASPARLTAALGLREVTASTIANIGPGIDFYFAFGAIAVTAGVAAPLTILAGGIAVSLLAFVAAEFTRLEPSSGSFITYVESGLGPRAGEVTTLLITGGFTVALAGVLTMAGGLISLTLGHYASWEPSWLPIALAMTAAAVALTLRGASLSTAAVAVALVLQVAVMLAVCIAVLADGSTRLTAAPFQWSHLHGGLAGLSAGFPLALYMLIGWENGPALAEETREPEKTIPRALYLSIAAATVLFVLFSYVTVAGFHYEMSDVGRASVPFLKLAGRYAHSWALLAWLAGIVSVLATLVAAVNAQGRMLFEAARVGLLPRFLARSRPPGDTPANAIVAMTLGGLAIVVVWWLCHETGLTGGPPHPVSLYAECSTLGTILVLFVYVLTAVSLPLFIRRRHRSSFSLLRHVAVPALGVLSLAVPFVELFQPGQPVPYSVFPYLSLAAVAAAVIFARLRRPPSAAGGTPRVDSPR